MSSSPGPVDDERRRSLGFLPVQTNPELDNLTFRSLREVDLGLVLDWRNKPHILSEMVSQKPISEADHISWFREIAARREEHFIYSHLRVDIGSVNLRIGNDGGSFEAGIFCGNEDYLGHSLNINALIWLYDYGFCSRQLPKAFVRVLQTNIKARRLNGFLGFLEEGEISPGVLRLGLVKNTYLENRKKIIRTMCPREPGNYGAEDAPNDSGLVAL